MEIKILLIETQIDKMMYEDSLIKIIVDTVLFEVWTVIFD